MPDAGDLPPLIAIVQLDIADFLAKVQVVSGQIDILTTKEPNIDIGANIADFESKMAAVNETLATWGRAEGVAEAGLAIDSTMVNFATINSALHAWGASDATGKANLDISEAVAKLASLKALENATISNYSQFQINKGLSATYPVGGGGGGGFLAGLLGGAGGGGGGSIGGMATGELLTRLLGFGPAASFGGLAGLGSLGSLAGFGPEHAAVLGLGLAGSATGGALGGGLLAGGALSTAAVGMGTDLAGIGQAAGDAKTAYTNLTALNAAIAEYGRNSTQAAAAQATLNAGLNSFSQIARGAVVQTAQTAQGFVQMFDAATGQAEKTGAEILTQAIKVGEGFLPTIGQYAAQNMDIMQKDLQPLFTWIGTQGLSIFADLEQKFQGELPTALDALTQGFELFAKTMDLAASYTGPFLIHLDEFLTKMNGADWGTWSGEVEKLIGDFHMWDAFIVILVKDIADLFSKDVGTASGIITTLTEALDKLHQWINSTTGSAELTDIFQVHKNEIMALLPVIGNLIDQYGHLFFTVAPYAVTVTTELVKAIGDFLTVIEKVGPLGDYALAILLITQHLGVLQPLLKAAFSTDVVKNALAGMSADLGTFVSSSGTAIGALGSKFGLIGTDAEAAGAKTAIIGTDADAAAVKVTAATTTMDADLAGVGAAAETAAGAAGGATGMAAIGTEAAAAATATEGAAAAMVLALDSLLGAAGPLALVLLGILAIKKAWDDLSTESQLPKPTTESAGAPVAPTGNLQTAIAELKALPPMNLASNSPAYLDMLAKQVVAAYHQANPQGPIPGGILPGTSGGAPLLPIPASGGRPESNLPPAGVAGLPGTATGVPGGSTNLAGTPPAGPTAAQTAAEKAQAAIIANAQAELGRLVADIHSKSMASIQSALTQIHQKGFADLITQLDGIHTAASKELVTRLSGLEEAAQKARTAESKAIDQAEAQARITATVNANSLEETAILKSATDLTNASVQFANDSQKMATDAAAAFATLTADASAINTAVSDAIVSAINDQTTIITDNANAQVSAITDQSQLITDQMAEAGLTGTALAAAQAQVAYDIEKQTDDAKVAADQLAIDTAKQTSDAKVNADTIVLAQQKYTDDAAIAAATQHADQVTLIQDQNVNNAQAAFDTASINAQSLVNAATIANAVADAGQNAKLQASTAIALANATNAQTGSVGPGGTATVALTNATNQANAAITNANNALAAVQSSAQVTEALLAAILASDTSQGNVQIALLEQQLATDVGAENIALAGFSASIQQLNEANTLAQQTATAASTTAAATTATAAATTAAAVPAPIVVTVVTQIDGQQVALTTTPYIRQELLRTTARQTQNIYGGAAGRLTPS